MTQATASAPAGRTRSRLTLIFIFALFALPLLFASLLYGTWGPAGRVNHGELLNPVQPLTTLDATAVDGAPLADDYHRGRWTLAYLADGDCDQRCQDGLYKIRQIRLALGGKNIDRIQTLALLRRPPDAALTDWLEREHAAMTAALASDGLADQLQQPFDARGGVFLLDPLGNLVMRYDAGAEPKGIIADLKRLLKLSQIG